MPINEINFNYFLNTLQDYQPQGNFGKVPSTFINQVINRIQNSGSVPHSELIELRDVLPNYVLNREQVFNICNNGNFSFAYQVACIFSWGNMTGGRSVSDLFFRNWGIYGPVLSNIITEFRNNINTRNWTYEKIRRMNLMGCGPAYFTKLIFFYSNRSSYIMDQWTSKSIEVLWEDPIGIKLARTGDNRHRVTNENHSGIYEEFCNRVEILTRRVNEILNTVLSPEQMEERIFSNGANGRIIGNWRQFVITNWQQIN